MSEKERCYGLVCKRHHREIEAIRAVNKAQHDALFGIVEGEPMFALLPGESLVEYAYGVTKENDSLRKELEGREVKIALLQAEREAKEGVWALVALAEAREQIAAATAALQRYGRHTDECDVNMAYDGPGSCDCGLQQAIAQKVLP